MAVTPASFLLDFGQFDGTEPKRIEGALRRAALQAGPAFGVHRDAAIGWLAAHYLATDPRNENMAHVKGMPGTTIYEQEYLKLVRAARPVGTTSRDPNTAPGDVP